MTRTTPTTPHKGRIVGGRPIPLPRRQAALFWLLAIVMVASSWHPLYPRNTLLQHAPTLLLLIAGPGLLRRWPLGDAAVGAILLFFLLHALGARYSYSFVPYDAWARALTGREIGATFGFARNHYDRLVHFAFGLLAVWPVREIGVRHIGLSPRMARWAAVTIMLAFGAVYEIFEWLLAVGMRPADAEAYNGQQGDAFDAQKDMAIALLGALLASVRVRRQG